VSKPKLFSGAVKSNWPWPECFQYRDLAVVVGPAFVAVSHQLTSDGVADFPKRVPRLLLRRRIRKSPNFRAIISGVRNLLPSRLTVCSRVAKCPRKRTAVAFDGITARDTGLINPQKVVRTSRPGQTQIPWLVAVQRSPLGPSRLLKCCCSAICPDSRAMWRGHATAHWHDRDFMPRTCSVCRHSSRNEIDYALVYRRPLRDIARQYATSKDALQRHRSHLSQELVTTLRASRMNSSSALLEQLSGLLERAYDIIEENEQSKPQIALSAIREGRGCLQLLAQVKGELRRSTMNLGEKEYGLFKEPKTREECERRIYEILARATVNPVPRSAVPLPAHHSDGL
jgi:hypothetical protein